MSCLADYILPYPYEPFDHYERNKRTFADYKKEIYAWVQRNVSSYDDTCYVMDQLLPDDCVSTVENDQVIDWMNQHISKVRYLSDFSGVSFGIVYNQEGERFEILYPNPDDCDKELLPDYNRDKFKDLCIIDKLEWLDAHCEEFIPFRVYYEDFDDDRSHKFSHIKKDSMTMSNLDSYLKDLEYPPRDEIYYSIHYSHRSNTWYLKRDLEKSPKKFQPKEE